MLLAVATVTKRAMNLMTVVLMFLHWLKYLVAELLLFHNKILVQLDLRRSLNNMLHKITYSIVPLVINYFVALVIVKKILE